MRGRKRLPELLGELGLSGPDIGISGISWDSRWVSPGDLFFALRGTKLDGHVFIPQAVERGAVAVVGERDIRGLPVPYIRVPDSREAMGKIAAAFWDYPTRKLITIGVTGTDGKTTVVHLLGQLLPDCETLTTVRVERERLSCVTTPEAPDIQRLAAAALERGKRYFALEASSIGLAQKRLVGTSFKVGVLTNLTRDHLDFHGTLENYRRAKRLLFEMLPEGGFAVVNGESPYAGEFLSATAARAIVYGISAGDIRAEKVKELGWGIEFELVTPDGRAEASVPFPGRFNLENALAAAAVAWALGIPVGYLVEALRRASLPPGRLARFMGERGVTAVVDYAHTPRALEAVLSVLRPRARKLIVVFGAPGEADRGKRPLMGKAVGEYADLAIVTSDNPKGEDPAAIAAELVRGLEEAGAAYRVELDRGRAIELALGEASAGDIVLIAGKGHERHQIVGGHHLPHSDIDCLHALGYSEVS